jgi:galactosamine-6-phosphate isomerase
MHHTSDMAYSGAKTALKLHVAENYEAMSREAALRILNALRRKPHFLLCASAGSTPTRAYEVLATYRKRNARLFSRLRVVQIDEWAGLPRRHPATCTMDLREKLIYPLRLNPGRFIGFNSDALQPRRECEHIARWLADHGPIDVCILGLGSNGHIAMNEPGDVLVPYVHMARLAKSSRNHSMLKALARKPRFGLTLGMGDILRSRSILLLVSGRKKRTALKRLCQPNVTPRFPASLLWLHPNVTVLCDREAASNVFG